MVLLRNPRTTRCSRRWEEGHQAKGRRRCREPEATFVRGVARWAAIPHFSRIIIPPDLTKNGRPSPVPSRSASRLQSREKLGCGCVRFDPPLWLPRCHTARSGEGPRLGRTAKRLSGTASGVALPHGMSREGRMGWDSMISLCGGGDAFNVPRMTRLGWIAAWGDRVQKHRVIARGVAVN